MEDFLVFGATTGGFTGFVGTAYRPILRPNFDATHTVGSHVILLAVLVDEGDELVLSLDGGNLAL